MAGHEATQLDAILQVLPADLLDVLVIAATPRVPDAGLLASVSGTALIDTLEEQLAALRALVPTLLAQSDQAPGYSIAAAARPALTSAIGRLARVRWTALHAQAAAYCALQAGNSEPDAVSWQTEETYHLWSAGAETCRDRLDTLFRQRLRARDADGCRALIRAVAEAGGGGDPLVSLCAGLLASELTRDWGEAEAHFQHVVAQPDLSLSLRARALMGLATLEDLQGRFDSALRTYDKSCRLAEEAGDVTLLARALTNKGIACTAGWMQRQLPRSALDEALDCLIRAKDLFLQLGIHPSALNAWNNLGAVYKEMGRYDEALGAYHEALALTLPEQHFIRAVLINNSAEVDMLQGRWTQAQVAYEEALAIWRETGGDFEIAEALTNLGLAQERGELVEQAIASYRAAITAVESLRAQLKAEEARSGFLATRLVPYERLIALCLAQPGREWLAFETVERAKARAFIELLADRPLRPPQAVPRRLLDREHALREALAHLYRMGAVAGSVGPAAARAASLEGELEEIYRQLRRLDAQYAGCRTIDPLSLEEVQRRLPPGTVLLEYFGIGEELGCFVIATTTVAVQLLPGVAAQLRRYLGTDAAEGRAIAGSIADLALDDGLYDALLAPIVPLLDRYDDLCIVPHGPLHYLPLHALGTPLLERHRVTYAPSASILVRDGSALDYAETTSQAGCLALGYGGADLHYAELEARHVAALTGGSAFVGAAATAAVLYGEGPAYRMLHVACHGTFNATAPLASGLLLADGKLDAMTILQGLRLHADLVVLSACDTGQAQVLRGDELMGLARAILYAGASAVMVSLWPVDDLATALLMDAFYRERMCLPDGPEGSAEALRQAQLALLDLSIEDALAGCARLRASAVSDQTEAGWGDLSLAALHAAAGDRVGAERLVAQAHGALSPDDARALEERLASQGGRVYEDGAQSRRPYAHPFYWAAFVLIRG